MRLGFKLFITIKKQHLKMFPEKLNEVSDLELNKFESNYRPTTLKREALANLGVNELAVERSGRLWHGYG